MNAGGKYLELTRGNTEIVLETLLTTIQIIEGFLGFLSCTVVDGVIINGNKFGPTQSVKTMKTF